MSEVGAVTSRASDTRAQALALRQCLIWAESDAGARAVPLLQQARENISSEAALQAALWVTRWSEIREKLNAP